MCSVEQGKVSTRGYKKGPRAGLHLASAEPLVSGDRTPLGRVCVGLESSGFDEFGLPAIIYTFRPFLSICNEPQCV